MKVLIKTRNIVLLLMSLSFYIFIIIPFMIVHLGITEYLPWFELVGYIALILWPVQIVIFLIFIFKNKSFKKDKKFLWGYLVLCFGPLLSPVYWYFYIWKSPKALNGEDKTIITISQIGNKGLNRTREKSKKYLLLLFTLLPFILTLVAILLVVLTEPTNHFVVVLGVPTGISILGILIYYIYDVYHNKSVDINSRALWTILLIFGYIVTLLFYWYYHIWREPELKTSDPPHLD